MANKKFSQTWIDKLKGPDPSGKPKLYWDENLTGFGVWVSGKKNVKTYVVQYAIGRGGKNPRLKIGATNALSLDQARAEVKEKLALFYKGIDPRASRRGEATVRSALEDYLKPGNDLRPRTAESYRDGVQRHLKKWLDVPLRNITPEMVEDRHREIAAGIAKDGRGDGHAAANGVMRTLRLLYNDAAKRAPRHDPMPRNPVDGLKMYELEERKGYVRDDQLPVFYQAVLSLPNPVQRDYLLLVLFTGLRKTESTSLRWQYVDFDRRAIRIPADITKAGRKLDLPMSDFVYDLLAARRELGNADGWVFPAPGRSGHIAEPRHPLRIVARATEIKVTCHDLRRTYASVCDGAGVEESKIAALLNHVAGAELTTTKRYIRTDPADRLRWPAKQVCDRLKMLCGIDFENAENP